MENEIVAASGFLRLTTALTALQRNLERVKSDRVSSIKLKNSEVFMVHLLGAASDGLSAEEIARTCRMDRSLISRNARSLIEKGLIVRPGSPEGKRSYGARLVLTEQGCRVANIIFDYVRNVQAFVDEGIPREDLETMYATLDRILDRFEIMNGMSKEKLIKSGLYVPE